MCIMCTPRANSGSFNLPFLVCALGAGIAGRYLHSRPVRSAVVALAYITGMVAYALAPALCQGVDAPGIPCDSYSRRGWRQCPPCASVMASLQVHRYTCKGWPACVAGHESWASTAIKPT